MTRSLYDAIEQREKSHWESIHADDYFQDFFKIIIITIINLRQILFLSLKYIRVFYSYNSQDKETVSPRVVTHVRGIFPYICCTAELIKCMSCTSFSVVAWWGGPLQDKAWDLELLARLELILTTHSLWLSGGWLAKSQFLQTRCLGKSLGLPQMVCKNMEDMILKKLGNEMGQISLALGRCPRPCESHLIPRIPETIIFLYC